MRYEQSEEEMEKVLVDGAIKVLRGLNELQSNLIGPDAEEWVEQFMLFIARKPTWRRFNLPSVGSYVVGPHGEDISAEVRWAACMDERADGEWYAKQSECVAPRDDSEIVEVVEASPEQLGMSSRSTSSDTIVRARELGLEVFNPEDCKGFSGFLTSHLPNGHFNAFFGYEGGAPIYVWYVKRDNQLTTVFSHGARPDEGSGFRFKDRILWRRVAPSAPLGPDLSSNP